MAKIDVTGWVSNWKFGSDEPNPEWAMKLAESHSKKNEAGGWETVGYTNFTVKAAYGQTFDFRQYSKGDKVRIIGTQKTEKRGDFSNLVINAESIEILPKGNAQTRVDSTLDDSAPF